MMRACGVLLMLAGGCRGFFDTRPVPIDGAAGSDAPPASPIQYVQSQLVSDNASYTQAQFPLAQQAGDTNLVIVSWTVGSLISLDDGTNTYSVAIGPTATAQIHQTIFVASNIKAGSGNKVTATFDITTLMRVALVEYSGVAAQPVDQVTSMTGDMTTQPMTGTLTTTAARDLVVGAAFSDPQLGATGLAGFTPRVGDTEVAVGDLSAASPGPYSSYLDTTSHGAWIMQLVALRAR